MTEWGIFNDEGCIEAGFYSADAANKAIDERYDRADETHASEICPDHEEEEKDGCWMCEQEECDKCSGPNPDGGDGFDGLCADCADAAVCERCYGDGKNCPDCGGTGTRGE